MSKYHKTNNLCIRLGCNRHLQNTASSILFIIGLFFITALLPADRATCVCPTVTYIPIHSQSFNTMRTLAGNLEHLYLPHAQQWYVTLSCTPEYIKSFRPERIVQSLFGTDIIRCKNTLTISGSGIQNRKNSEWLADYFGLPTDFKSYVTFNPRVKNKLIDNYLFLGLDGITPGLFASIDMPLVQTIWGLNYCETVTNPGSRGYIDGYFAPTTLARSELVPDFTSFITGCATPHIPDALFHPLMNARMSTCERTYSSFSDPQILLGYIFYNTKMAHMELHARASFPVGNRPRGDFLFEPIIGDGYHKELGGGISMHWTHYEPEEHAAVRLDLQCDAVHLFETCQRRSFDLKGKPNSRYMLAQQMGTPIEDRLSGPAGTEPIQAQFKKLFTPVANLTTCDCKVSNAAQIDFTFLFSYLTDNDSWSFGYGIWSCSPDKITLCDTHIEPNTWALKGDAQLYGFDQHDGNKPVALSATQSAATIHAGTNKGDAQNPAIDNPQAAYVNHTHPLSPAPSSTPAQTINTSVQPIFLSTSDIDINSARSHGFANRIMSHWAHTWQGDHFTGTFGFGAEVEFGMRHYLARKKPEDILNSALSYWGFWLKASITFK
jgi:hypothetical protein